MNNPESNLSKYYKHARKALDFASWYCSFRMRSFSAHVSIQKCVTQKSTPFPCFRIVLVSFFLVQRVSEEEKNAMYLCHYAVFGKFDLVNDVIYHIQIVTVKIILWTLIKIVEVYHDSWYNQIEGDGKCHNEQIILLPCQKKVIPKFDSKVFAWHQPNHPSFLDLNIWIVISTQSGGVQLDHKHCPYAAQRHTTHQYNSNVELPCLMVDIRCWSMLQEQKWGQLIYWWLFICTYNILVGTSEIHDLKQHMP